MFNKPTIYVKMKTIKDVLWVINVMFFGNHSKVLYFFIKKIPKYSEILIFNNILKSTFLQKDSGTLHIISELSSSD